MTGLAPAPVNAVNEEVLAWLAGKTGATDLVASYPDPPGRSRDIWLIDGRKPDGSPLSCVVRHESGVGPWTGTSFTLGREGATLRALEGTGVPAPKVIAVSDDGDTLAIERLAGTANFVFEDEAQRFRTIDAWLKALVTLHGLPVHEMDLPFEVPQTPADHALINLAQYREIYARCAQRPEMDAAYAWLEANAPTQVTRTAFIQGDAGPGNFLHLDGRITGIVDWEAAHVSDPMDDLAWLWFRKCFLRRDTDLGYWYARYAELSGRPLDLKLMSYYRVMVATRAATSTLNRQIYEAVYEGAKIEMMVGLVTAAMRDPFGTLGDPQALPPLAVDPIPTPARS